MKDIEKREDIELLVDTFYQKVIKDPVIGYLFNEVVPLNWELHIPKMYDFWESVLLDSQNYRGNPMKAHLDLHVKEALKKEHFDQWLVLFDQTLKELFSGPKADLALVRAQSIATVIQAKIYQFEKGMVG
ncbi:group III truncated hemoglobin [bacterium SCSIO 12741]|nr:group III truncated hemoglobin [bacterium SCSIO 12741]